MIGRALDELRRGQKTSHWMWFVFPQHRDLGRSATSRLYGLTGVDEARAYLDHPLLGPRLIEAAATVLLHLDAGRTAEAMFGEVDSLKLRSSMSIFEEADPGEPLFRAVLAAMDKAAH